MYAEMLVKDQNTFVSRRKLSDHMRSFFGTDAVRG